MKANNLIKSAFLIMVMTLFAMSCATSEGAGGKSRKAKAYDPTGTWEYFVDTPDGGSGGNMVLSGNPGAYMGSLETDQFGTLEMTGIDIQGTQMTAAIDVMGMAADIECSFDGDNMTGTVYLGDDAFPMEGTRVSK